MQPESGMLQKVNKNLDPDPFPAGIMAQRLQYAFALLLDETLLRRKILWN